VKITCFTGALVTSRNARMARVALASVVPASITTTPSGSTRNANVLKSKPSAK
jgi:hypothetical protein